ncbi:hypothetical protein CK507_06340 [Pseudomonas sp. WN033]|nr:hypothetical protein CK507_06340 [Pseudomonas sp. WN033]
MFNSPTPMHYRPDAPRKINAFNLLNVNTSIQPIFDRQLKTFAHELLPRPDTLRPGDIARFLENSTVSQLNVFYTAALTSVKHHYSTASFGLPSSQQPEHPLVFLRVNKDCLCNFQIQTSLINTAQTLALFGYKLIVILPNAPLRQGNTTQRLYAALYALNDAGIDLATSRIDTRNDPDINQLFPWHLIKFIFSSAERVGISLSESSFHPDLYHQAADNLTELLNQHPVSLILNQIDNPWQACLARTLPVHYFQGRYYGAQKSL